jgi:hypothetical protein
MTCVRLSAWQGREALAEAGLCLLGPAPGLSATNRARPAKLHHSDEPVFSPAAADSASRRACRSSRWAWALPLAASVRCSGVCWRSSASALRSASSALPARTFTALLSGAMTTSVILMPARPSWSSTAALVALTTRCVRASASSSARRLVVSPSKSLGHAIERPSAVAPLTIRALAVELATHTPHRGGPSLGHLLCLSAPLGTVARKGEGESLTGGSAQLTLLPGLGRRERPLADIPNEQETPNDRPHRRPREQLGLQRQ